MAYVRCERAGEHIALVTLDRTERLNALSFDLLREFHGVLDDLDADPSVRVVVLTGAGRGFCAGLDLKAMQNDENGHWEEGLGRVQELYRMQQGFGGLVARMRQIPQPLIAAVNGAAAGGGFSVALACDVRICAPEAKFNCAYTRIGLGGGDMGSSFFLPKAVGPALAAELMYTGRFVDAQEAFEVGLVSRVVESHDLVDVAIELAEQMVAFAAPFGLRMTKELLNQVQGGLSLEQALHLENRTQILAFHTKDFRGAVANWKHLDTFSFTDQ